jgi:hypothetical protein
MQMQSSFDVKIKLLAVHFSLEKNQKELELQCTKVHIYWGWINAAVKIILQFGTAQKLERN